MSHPTTRTFDRIEIEARYDIFDRSKELVKSCAQYPHMVLEFSTEAQDYFDSYAAMYNIRGEQLRVGQDADAAAEEGIGPWKIGMRSACIYCWDVLWKQESVVGGM